MRCDRLRIGLLGGSITGTVWNDRNADGIHDGTEPGLPNVTVQLLQSGAGVVQTATTDSNGIYQFFGLVPANRYAIRPVGPDNYMVTFFHQGPDDTRDSDIDEKSGRSNYAQGPAAGQISVIDAGYISLTAHPLDTIVGPKTVPGNSQYTFTITRNRFVGNLKWVVEVTDPVNPPPDVANQVAKDFSPVNSITGVAVSSVTLQFGNSVPAVVVLKAMQGNKEIASLEIVVVKVTVTTPAASLVPGTPFDETAAKGFGNDETNKTNTAVKSIASGFPSMLLGPLGFQWRATVTLTGPQGNRGVDQIRVGFIQHVNVQQLQGRYLVKTAGQDSTLVSSLQSASTYSLDSSIDDTQRPWYDRNASAVSFAPTAASAVKTLISFDSPNLPIPLAFQQASFADVTAALPPNTNTFKTDYRRLEQISLIERFNLDVAVTTADTANGGDVTFWGESRVQWVYNGSGIVGDQPNFEWTPRGAGVSSDTSWVGLGLTYEDTSGLVANAELAKITWTAAK